jgi:phosphate-selective porin OprO/OprP
MVSRLRAGLLTATALSCIAAAPAVARPAARHKVDPRDQRIEALEAEVRDLRAIVTDIRARETETAQAVTKVAAAAPAPGGGGVTILAGKPSIASADGRFAANLHGVVQFDAAGYFQKKAGPIGTDFRRGAASGDTAHARDLNNGTNFRRVRIGIDGKVFNDWDYNVLFEFGGAGAEDAGHIQEAWLQYSGFKPFRVRIGAFPPSIGLEDQNSTNGMPFLERPAISDIARSIAGGDFREAIQFQASTSRWLASLALTTRTVGTINSTGSSTAQSFDQAFGGIIRLAAIPFQGDDWMVHVGAHGSRVFSVADNGGPDAAITGRYPVQFRERPELRVDGTRLIDSGAINAKHVNEGGLELAFQKQQFYIQGEYEKIGVERFASALSNPHFSGWYVEGSWILTGERRKYNLSNFAFDAPTIDHPFDPANGSWGAFELAGRYSTVDLNYHAGQRGSATPSDGVRGGKQTIMAAGLNWYPNSVIRFMVDYQHVKVSRLSPNAGIFQTPVGAQIGQHYDTVAVRSQLAF